MWTEKGGDISNLPEPFGKPLLKNVLRKVQTTRDMRLLCCSYLKRKAREINFSRPKEFAYLFL
jgi:hypothetical protein